jgi:hypothetical protein
MRVIPPTRARFAQIALLKALLSLLEAASENASRTHASEVAELCADSAKIAAVIDLLGRRSMADHGVV